MDLFTFDKTRNGLTINTYHMQCWSLRILLIVCIHRYRRLSSPAQLLMV